MSQQKIQMQTAQLTTTTPFTLLTDYPGQISPPDITKLILANTSATPVLVTVSDGINNYYYEVPANSTIVDNGGLSSDGGDIAINAPASTKWTVTLAANVTSIYVTAVFD